MRTKNINHTHKEKKRKEILQIILSMNINKSTIRFNWYYFKVIHINSTKIIKKSFIIHSISKSFWELAISFKPIIGESISPYYLNGGISVGFESL